MSAIYETDTLSGVRDCFGEKSVFPSVLRADARSLPSKSVGDIRTSMKIVGEIRASADTLYVKSISY